MNKRALPPSWRVTMLGEIAAPVPNAIVDGPFGSNLKLSDYVEEGVPVLQGKNITGDTFQWSDVRFISDRKAGELKRSSVRVGDILLVKIGSIGYSAVIRDLQGFDFAVIPANLAKITPDPAVVDTQYLHRWLTSPDAKHYLENAASKTAQPALSLGKIRNLPVPLPPLPEQRRIAEVLDRAETLRAKRRATLAQLDTLTQTLFLELFGDPNKDSNFPCSVLSECASVVSGIAKGRKLDGKRKILAPYLRVANVQAGFLDLTEIKTIEALPSEVAELALMPGDVVMTEGGDHDKLGRGALWEGQIVGCIHQNHVFRVRPDQSKMLPGYFHEFLQTSAARGYFLRCAKRTTNLASINMTQLRALAVPLPPLSLQHKFARRVAAVEKLRAAYRVSLAELNALFASLQHRAFRGEL